MDRRTAYRLTDYRNRCREALIQGMVLRAVHSQRQLLERMVDFWTDHFNVPSRDLEPRGRRLSARGDSRSRVE